MAHTAQLAFKSENKKYPVIECEYELIQPVKENGQPSGQPLGGIVHLAIVSPDDSDLFLHEWMRSSTEDKSGTIVFSVVDAGKSSEKTLHFKRAFCVRMYEYFNGYSDGQMYTKMTISADEISFGKGGSITFKNNEY